MSINHPQPDRPLPELAPRRGVFRVVGLVLAAFCLLVVFAPPLVALLT